MVYEWCCDCICCVNGFFLCILSFKWIVFLNIDWELGVFLFVIILVVLDLGENFGLELNLFSERLELLVFKFLLLVFGSIVFCVIFYVVGNKKWRNGEVVLRGGFVWRSDCK